MTLLQGHSGERLSMVARGGSQISAEAAVYAVLPALFLLGAVSLCVRGCRKKQVSSNASDEAELNNGDAGNGGSIKTIEIDLSNEANSRPLSHDRALPEIPAIPSGVTSTDDDEEDDEGHYDIISKGKKVRDQANISAAGPAIPTSSTSNTSKKKVRSHPYEKVHGDPDSDSVYAGIKDEFIVSANFPSSKLSLHGRNSGDAGKSAGCVVSAESLPSADSVTSNLYATVGTGEDTRSGGKSNFKTDAFPRIAQGLTLAAHNADIVGGAAGTSVGGIVPTVSQMFEDVEEGNPMTGRLDSSPSLPPRNCDVVVGSGSGVGPAGDGAGRTSGSGISFGLMPSVAPWTTMAAYPSLIIDINDDGSAAAAANAGTSQTGSSVPAKRVPDYSSVTARESLESLRKRQLQQQAHQMRIAHFPDIDGTYDTINYDQVKMPAVVSRTVTSSVSENTYNNGSDLYAEIATETNSARSSTYAKVGDLSIVGSSNVSDLCPLPPAPPSVNTLQQLTNSSLDDHADPGYSRVDNQRPRSVHYAPNSASAASHSSVVGRAPVYAVVNKSANPNRQTIHVDENVDWGLRRNGENDSLANLYAKVSKPKNHRRTSSSGASFGASEPSTSGAAFGGARPKTRAPGGHVVELGRADHGYATIDNVVNGVNNRDDPDYDVVGDGNSIDGIPEYDPNYETVAVVPTASNGITRSSMNCGVAHEIVPNGAVGQTTVLPWHHPRREHIYEVVSDSAVRSGRGVSSNSSHLNSTEL